MCDSGPKARRDCDRDVAHWLQAVQRQSRQVAESSSRLAERGRLSVDECLFDACCFVMTKYSDGHDHDHDHDHDGREPV
jgi:hypothetical protein